MKGYVVNFSLYGGVPEISRQLILPQGLSFNDLEQIIYVIFSFSGYHNSEFRFKNINEVFNEDKTVVIDRYFDDEIYFNYDFGDDFWIIIALDEIVEYDKAYVTFNSYRGEYNPVEDCGGVDIFNNMLKFKNNLRKINPEVIQKKLMKIKVYNYEAYDIKIKYESDELIWRDFLIPFETGFDEIEKIIELTFNQKVSFSLNGAFVDDYFREQSKMFSDDYNFTIFVKKIVRYDKKYPTLKRFKGGDNPFKLWCKHYPCEEIKSKIDDKNQTKLDDFI